MKTINSWDELLDAGVQAIIDDISPEDLTLSDDLIFRLQVKGESWDGFIDYRGAQFIIDLQKAVIETYKELNQSEISLHKLKKIVIVKMKVTEGCSLFEIKFNKIFKTMAENMSGTQITLIAGLAIVCATGYFTTGKVLQYKQQALQKAQEKEVSEMYITKVSDAMDKALDIINRKDIEAPPRKLIGKLRKEDSIRLPGTDLMRAEKAKDLYPKKPKIRTESGYFDARYVITAINMEKRPVQFKLVFDGFDFWAKAALDHKDIERISRSLETSMKENKDLEIDLHLFVLFNKREFKSATIQATGSARENSQDLKEKIELWRETQPAKLMKNL